MSSSTLDVALPTSQIWQKYKVMATAINLCLKKRQWSLTCDHENWNWSDEDPLILLRVAARGQEFSLPLENGTELTGDKDKLLECLSPEILERDDDSEIMPLLHQHVDQLLQNLINENMLVLRADPDTDAELLEVTQSRRGLAEATVYLEVSSTRKTMDLIPSTTQGLLLSELLNDEELAVVKAAGRKRFRNC